MGQANFDPSKQRGKCFISLSPLKKNLYPAMSKIVRTSKFRHVFAEPAKPENQFSDLELR